MARIPTYQTRVGSIDVGGGVNLPPEDQTLARSIENMGVSISQVAQHIQARQQQQSTFSAEQGFLQFQKQVKEDYVRSQSTDMSATGSGWHDTWTPNVPGSSGTFDKAANDFLAKVPPDLRQQYAPRIATFRSALSLTAANDEINAGQSWFKAGIAEQTKGLETEIRRGGAINFDEYRQQGDDLIAKSGLSPVTKAELTIKWHAEAAKARSLGIAANDPQAALDEIHGWLSPPKTGPNGKAPTDLTAAASAILRQEEGFVSGSSWDVDAYRLGYGSDTITTAEGKVVRVKQGDWVSRADAERDLQRRLPDFINVAAGDVGSGFTKLPTNVQAALVSVAYNYGHVPKSVVAAAQSGDPAQIADAVQALGLNPGINNPERRKREAAVIRGGAISPLGDLSPDQLDALGNNIQGIVNQQRTEDNRVAAQGREDLVKFGEDLIHNSADPTKPQLTEAWVAANRDNLNASEYKYFKSALNKDESAIHTPPQELLRLDDMVQSDPKKALTSLREEFANRTITRGTYDQLATRAQGIINGEEKRPFIGQIRDYLKQQIAPGTDASSAEYQTALTQLFAFDNWATQHKDATSQDAQREATTIIARRQAYRTEALRQTLPLPRFMDAPNRYVIGPDQVTEAKARTAKAFADKTISAEEAAAEANKIKAWESVVSTPNQLPAR